MPADDMQLSGMSYDNTRRLSATTPVLPERRTDQGLLTGMLTMAALGAAAALSFAADRQR